MPIYLLDNNDKNFPNANLATKEGIIAVGGDLSVERLINAYTSGIFPWFSEGEPILWWSPNPRGVLFLEDFKISKSMKKFLKKEVYNVTFDKNFEQIMFLCGETRRNKEGTWITKEMVEAYLKLHKLGVAHSVEVWDIDGNIAGGLYGISFGRMFFGESMFSNKENASKTALKFLVDKLLQYKFKIIDCQLYTEHLASLGAKNISRLDYLNILSEELSYPTLNGNWNKI